MRTKPYPGPEVSYSDFAVEIVANAAATASQDDDLVEMIASNETPMDRYGATPDGNWGAYREQLDHSAGAVQLDRMKSGRAPVLVEHERGVQIGVIDSVKIVGGAMRLVTRFSKNPLAQEYLADIRNKIRRSVSIGWLPLSAKLIEEDAEKGDLWRTTKWQPFEVSMVSVPANPEARVAHNAGGRSAFHPVVVEREPGGSAMEDEKVTPAEKTATKDAPDAEQRIEIDERENERKAMAQEYAEIYRLCREFNQASKAPSWIEQGLGLTEVRAKLLELQKPGVRKGSPEPGTTASQDGTVTSRIDVGGAALGMNKQDREQYSYARALALGAGLRDGSTKWAGLEARVSDAIEAKLPPGFPKQGGMFVPLDLRSPEEQWDAGVRRAALDSKTLTKGNEVVFEQPGELIELLRNRTVVIAMGARVLTGLTGPVTFPKQTGAMTFYWVGENPASDVAASDLTLGLVTLAPKTLQGTTSYSRQLLQQASIDVEQMVRNEMSMGHALAIDRAAIHGLGVNGEPMGAYVTPGVGSQAFGGAVTFANVVSMMSIVATKNADEGRLGTITTPALAAKLKTKPEDATAAMANWLWQGTFRDGTLAGYPARSTNQVSSTMTGTAGATTGGSDQGIVFGNWGDLLIGMFGGLEVIVDPYAQKKRGMIEVTSFQMVDVAIRHAESFAKGTGATTA